MPTDFVEVGDHKWHYSFEYKDTYHEWGPPGDNCWEFWKVEPCCGDPCTVGEGAYCCLNWCFCSLCNFPYFIAHGLEQKCAIKNHLLPLAVAWALGIIPCIGICLGMPAQCYLLSHYRANTRGRFDGAPGDDECQLGDCIMGAIPCIACFSYCQGLRTIPKNEEGLFPWDALGQCQRHGFSETYLQWDHGAPFYISREEKRLYPRGQGLLDDGGKPGGDPERLDASLLSEDEKRATYESTGSVGGSTRDTMYQPPAVVQVEKEDDGGGVGEPEV
eukprot:TRINITY_DN6274_c0_g1_i1.p1 TRINITY_DN6274_c0_g1~~TRINITY_DN6274_c0_g1_i1.p1  ORF type:complete len:274 (-),score=37.92 TRINITY_DN6274_c0_g1_i1:108-929(-)